MATIAKSKGRLSTGFKNDETFGSLNLKTFVFIALTVTLFQMGENVSSVFAYIAIGVMLVGSLVIETDQIAIVYIVLAASNRLLNVGNNIPLLPVITIVYIARVYFLQKRYKKVRMDTQMLSILTVFTIYSLRFFFVNFSTVNFILFSTSVKLFFSFIMLMDVFKVCQTKDEARIKFNQIVFYMSMGITLTVLISLIFSFTGNSLERFSISIDSGANVLGIYVASSIAASVLIILSENTALLKRVMAIMIVPMAYVGLLTQSRTFVILSIIIILWAAFLGFTNSQTRANTGLFFIIASVVVVLFLIFGRKTNLYNLFYTIIDRFINPRHDDVTGGRTELAKAYLTTIFGSLKYLFFGSDNSLPSPGGGVVAHNMFIEVLYGNGLVGVAMVCAIYVIFFKKIAESFKRLGFTFSLLGALPFVLCFVGGMSSHTILGAMPTNEFFIGVCSMYYYGNHLAQKRSPKVKPLSPRQRTYQRSLNRSDVKGEQ